MTTANNSPAAASPREGRRENDGLTREGARRVLVCGGRDFGDASVVDRALGYLHRTVGIAAIIEGGASGADALARTWAIANGVTVDQYAAEWRQFGRSAGPRRNAQMLAEGKPTLVVAFPGGRGTADMIAKAKAAHVPVITVTLDQPPVASRSAFPPAGAE